MARGRRPPPAPPDAGAETPTGLILRFISGKYEGGEFPLMKNRELLIGRSQDMDICLVEDMVSRKHAKIATTGGQVVIQDLGSTNGTFVNGEKIRKQRLKQGDRILVGTSILKLVSADEGTGDGESLEEVAARRPKAEGISGSIEDVPLPDVLQLLSTSRKSGVLVIKGTRTGNIYLRDGQIFFANLDENFDLNPLKVLFRILAWPRGSYKLEAPVKRTFPSEIKDSTESLLMEGMRQLDELKRLKGQIPSLKAKLALARPMKPALKSLSPDQLEVLQLIHNAVKLQLVLNRCSLTDMETLKAVVFLIEKGYVRQVK